MVSKKIIKTLKSMRCCEVKYKYESLIYQKSLINHLKISSI